MVGPSLIRVEAIEDACIKVRHICPDQFRFLKDRPHHAPCKFSSKL